MVYAAFFRGINVGGKNKVQMSGLRSFLEGLGFKRVMTYIQSGNAVFETDMSERECQSAIASRFKAQFGFESGVALRNAGELCGMVRNPPFSPDEIALVEAADPSVEHLYVYMTADCADMPETMASAGADKLVSDGRNIFLLCQGSVRDSQAARALGKGGLGLTARNMKTIVKVFDMVTTARES